VEAAAEAIDRLRAMDATVATAESLTGGLVCATLVDVPGASDVVAGAVVTYATRLKVDLLGVDARLLAERGTVDPAIAEQMAERARVVCAATYGVAPTGVAGPGPHEGHPAGTVHVAVAGPSGTTSQRLALDGTRQEVRLGAVAAAVSLLVATLGMNPSTPDVDPYETRTEESR
jgi:nicotinamide-nucleotide amidase